MDAPALVVVGPATKPKRDPVKSQGRRRVGGYAVAGVLHALLLLLPVYGLFMARPSAPPKAVEVRLGRSDAPITDEPRESPETRLEVDAELENALEGVEADAPFQEALGNLTKNDVGDIDAKAFGLSFGASAGRGRGGGGGPSAASEGAVHEGLEWLARHQLEDGSWGPARGRSRGFRDDCDLSPRARRTRVGQVGHTGLALLCFLAAKQGPKTEGPYRKVVRRAEWWLMSRTRRGGGFTLNESAQASFYQHAIGTLALSESLQLWDRPTLRSYVQRHVRFLELTRGVFGWRYGSGGSDTSVLAWVILALKSAEHAGLKVDEKNYVTARKWLSRVTTRAGRTGYLEPHKRNGHGMTASGLFLRILLGESPNRHRNRAAARRIAKLNVVHRGPRRGVINLYAVYYASLAMYQVGGSRWRAFNPKIRDALVAVRSHEGCARGSWHGSGWVNGRILATCFATLTLETYYRYLRVQPRASELIEKALLATLERVNGLNESSPSADLAASEQALLGVLGKIKAAKMEWEAEGEARAALVRLAHLQRDPTKADLYITAYWKAIPVDAHPHAYVVGARNLARLQTSLQAFHAAAKTAKAALEADEPRIAKAARFKLRTAVSDLRMQVRSVPSDRAATIGKRVGRLLRHSDELIAALTFHDVDSGIADALHRLALKRPTGPVGPLEQRLMAELAGRANLQLGIARADRDAEALRKGTEDLALLAKRKPERLSGKAAAAIHPVIRRARLSRVAALIALDLPGKALAEADAFLADDPGPLAPQAQRLVERLLRVKFERGRARRSERKRLLKLLAVAPNPSTADRMLLASVFLSLDRIAAADKILARAIAERKAGEDPTPLLMAHARIQVRLGRYTAATGLLDRLPLLDRRRLEVVLMRAVILRRTGKPAEALVIYKGLLRTLTKTPKAWWEVAEEAVRTYVEAGEPAASRRFLERLRLKDIALGNRPGLMALWNRDGCCPTGSGSRPAGHHKH